MVQPLLDALLDDVFHGLLRWGLPLGGGPITTSPAVNGESASWWVAAFGIIAI